MATVQIPILFEADTSDTALQLFGEAAPTDFFNHHTEFTIAASANLAASDLACFEVGDSADANTSDIFYCSTKAALDEACDKIATAIITGTLTQTNPATKKVPIGGKTTETFFTDNMGTGTLGAQMAKIASIHLVGHPLAQAIFTNEQAIQTQLTTVTTTDSNSSNNSGKYATALAAQLGKALGGKAATNEFNTGSGTAGYDATVGVTKASATANPQMKSIFEQLMNVAGRSNDISSAREVSATHTAVAALPFKAGDTLTFYIRGKIKLAVETAVMGGDGNVSLVNHAGAAVAHDSDFATGNASTAAVLGTTFPGAGQATFKEDCFNWMGHGSNSAFNASVTDLTDTDVLDCHTMKVTIALN
tara:strand:+ start:5432 stop:6517 length:1086 start_codon:yes stop_codon:yes gene_type:complete